MATFTVVNTADSGTGSLRWAITEANKTTVKDTIVFNIPSFVVPSFVVPTIRPRTALPAITSPVVLDGTTQPLAHLVELNGANTAPPIKPLNAKADGLVVKGADTTVKGLVINRFSGSGVVLAGTGGHHLEGNRIGTDKTGNADLGNGKYGVLVQSRLNVIGGLSAGMRNVISGNGLDGIRITGANATWNWVLGNYIGTNIAGTGSIPNSVAGVTLESAGNHIGSPQPGARNVISGNALYGVNIIGSAASGNAVIGNYIGVDKTGTAALGQGRGVRISGASNNMIGAAADGARNVISGNSSHGVQVESGAGNQVSGNFIGLDYSGNIALPNGDSGVYVAGAPNTMIGGVTALARNVISGNGKYGIFVAAAPGTQIVGNYIGTDVTGGAARGNPTAGVLARNTTDVTIGGVEAAARNVISGNGTGIHIVMQDGLGLDLTNNRVVGNYIGVDANGVGRLGNATHGVWLENTSGNTIGGTTAGAGNTIAFNGTNGVTVEFGIGNAIMGNSIYGNAALGIDLGNDGATMNDAGDADLGANNQQNTPVLTAASRTATSVTIAGSLNSTANTTFDVEFFATTPGGAQKFLGRARLTTNAAGNVAFTLTFDIAVAAGDVITATATRLVDDDANANTPLVPFETSEFSAGRTV